MQFKCCGERMQKVVRQTTSSHSLWTQQLLRNGVLGKLPGSYSEGGSEVIIVSCKYIRALRRTLGIPSQIQRTQLQNESYKGAQKAGHVENLPNIQPSL